MQLAAVSCLLAVARAGIIAGPAAYASYAEPSYQTYSAPAYQTYSAPAYQTYSAPALTATSENVYRSPGNLHSVSTQSKSIATPFSVSNKHFTSVTNPGVYAHATPVAYPGPVAHAAGPAVAHYSPAVAVSHMSYSSPVGINYSW